MTISIKLAIITVILLQIAKSLIIYLGKSDNFFKTKPNTTIALIAILGSTAILNEIALIIVHPDSDWTGPGIIIGGSTSISATAWRLWKKEKHNKSRKQLV